MPRRRLLAAASGAASSRYAPSVPAPARARISIATKSSTGMPPPCRGSRARAPAAAGPTASPAGTITSPSAKASVTSSTRRRASARAASVACASIVMLAETRGATRAVTRRICSLFEIAGDALLHGLPDGDHLGVADVAGQDVGQEPQRLLPHGAPIAGVELQQQEVRRAHAEVGDGVEGAPLLGLAEAPVAAHRVDRVEGVAEGGDLPRADAGIEDQHRRDRPPPPPPGRGRWRPRRRRARRWRRPRRRRPPRPASAAVRRPGWGSARG